MPRTLIATNGTAGTPVNTADPTGVKGDIQFNSTEGALKLFDASWLTLGTTSNTMVSGITIFVDGLSIYATDTRTGLNKYSANRPFKTIQAAVDASAQNDTIYVCRAVYTETITSASGYLNLVLAPLVLIQGTITAALQLFIRGDYPIHPQDLYGGNEYSEPLYAGYSRIISNTSTPTINMPATSVLQSLLTGIHVENQGSGDAMYLPRGASVERCRAIANGGVAINFQGDRTGRVNGCYAKSTGSHAIYAALYVANSTAISLGPTSQGIGASCNMAENSRIYSANSVALNTATVIRNCMINSWDLISSIGLDDGSPYHIEIANNIINVRNPSQPNAFYLLFNRGVAEPALIVNNQFNKSQYVCSCNAAVSTLQNIEANNNFDLPFGPSTPRIGNALSPILAEAFIAPEDPLNP